MGVAEGQNASSSDYRQSTRLTRTEVTRISPRHIGDADRMTGKITAAETDCEFRPGSRTRELNEAPEQQAATSEVPQIILAVSFQ